MSPRPYARLNQIKPGDILITDAAFDCMGKNRAKRVQMTKVHRGTRGFTSMKFRLWIPCCEGKHMLGSQLNDQGRLVGLRRPLT